MLQAVPIIPWWHTLRGDKVTVLTHTYLHKPVRKIKVTICNHQADSPLYVGPDVWSGDLQIRKHNKHNTDQVSFSNPNPNSTLDDVCLCLSVSGSNESVVWSLCEALWGELAALAGVGEFSNYQTQHIRRRALSKWLSEVALPKVQKEVTHTNHKVSICTSAQYTCSLWHKGRNIIICRWVQNSQQPCCLKHTFLQGVEWLIYSSQYSLSMFLSI